MTDLRALSTRQRAFGAGIVGGIVGALLTIVLLLYAAPAMLSTKIVRDGLLADPGVLTETFDALRNAQYAPVLAQNREAIETPFASSWKGATRPTVTLVEFFDYACPYCKASNPAVERLLKEDKGLRVVFRDLPILGPDSVTAAELSLEASKIGRFAVFHDTLWQAGRPAPDTNAKAASAAGISPIPGDDPQVKAELQRNMKLASELGATGTPLFIVGNRVINGAVGYDTLKDAIAKARSKA